MEPLSKEGSSFGSAGRFLSAKSVYDANKKVSVKQGLANKKTKSKRPSVKVKELATSNKKKQRKTSSTGKTKNANTTNKTGGQQQNGVNPKINKARVQSFLKTTESLISNKPASCSVELESTDESMDTNEASSNDEQMGSNSLSMLDNMLSNQSSQVDSHTYNLTGGKPVYQTLYSLDYEILNESEAVAFIPFTTCFYFKGRLQVTVLGGIIDFLGYTMEEDHKQVYDVYSPRGYSLNCIRSIEKSSKNTNLKAIATLLTEAGHSCDEEFLQRKSSSCAIILLRLLDSGLIRYTSRLFRVNILKKEECTPSSWDDEAGRKFGKLCNILDTSIILREAAFSARYYQQPDEWYEFTQQLIDNAKKNETVRLMLLGGKGVGKSTLLRYIVNRLIQSFGSVLVLDFDPGQPELFPAGCVSASLITEPLLGPNFTHFQQPLHCYHIGDVDVTACPDRYVQSCNKLINDCKMNPSLARTPTLINTMGFTNGMGLDLALDLIRLSQPLQVLHITSRSSRRRYPSLMDHEYVTHHRRGWMTSNDSSDGLPAYTLLAIESEAEHSEKCLEEWGFRPRELRDIGLMSYFGNLSNSAEWTLTDAVPYRISWHALAICISHQSIPPNSVFAALNASLVALCILDSEVASSVPRYQAKEGNYPTVLKELPIMPCIGYGVVRNIDVKNGHLYLITPEPVDRLERVNCLVLGGVRLPDSMLLDQPTALQVRRGKESIQVPYATSGPSFSLPVCRPYRRYNPLFTLRNQT